MPAEHRNHRKLIQYLLITDNQFKFNIHFWWEIFNGVSVKLAAAECFSSRNAHDTLMNGFDKFERKRLFNLWVASLGWYLNLGYFCYNINFSFFSNSEPFALR